MNRLLRTFVDGRGIEMTESNLDPNLIEILLHQIFPEKPQLISKDFRLNNLFLADYQHHSWELPEHNVPFHVLEVIDRNSCSDHQRRFNGEKYDKPLSGGEILFYPADTDHSVRWEETMKFALMIFHPKLFEIEFGCNRADFFPVSQYFDPHIHSLVDAIKQDLEAGCPLGSAYSDAQALALAAQIFKRMKVVKDSISERSDGLSKLKLAEVRDFIQSKIDVGEDPQLGEMAKIVGMNQCYFLKLFKNSLGITPGKYVTQQRIEMAQYLLKTTKYSITEVASRCGFSTRNFNDIFKKVVGVSPSKFRKEFP